MQALRQLLTQFGVLTAHPLAFAVVAIYTAAWVLLDPESFDWHGIATIATWLMTLFIQRAEHRDTQAIQAKLDELLHASGKADNALTKLDEKEPEEIEEHRAAAREGD
jgi:low affinity Fe/Cu permease